MTAGSAENQGQLEFGREDSLHQLSASVLAAFDLKELPDLSYGCPLNSAAG